MNETLASPPEYPSPKSDTQFRIENFHSWIHRIACRLPTIKRIDYMPNTFSVFLYDQKQRSFEAKLNLTQGQVVLLPVWPVFEIKGSKVKFSSSDDRDTPEDRRQRVSFSIDLPIEDAALKIRDRFLPYFDFVMDRCEEQYLLEVERRDWMDRQIESLRGVLGTLPALVHGNELKFPSSRGGENVAIAEGFGNGSIQLILNVAPGEAANILDYLRGQLLAQQVDQAPKKPTKHVRV